ncbi:MAG: Hsp20/alpha crystallin family protein [Planctomycetota bacterium]|jgi:HSP20 family protein
MDIVRRRRKRGEPLARLHEDMDDLFGRFLEDWPFAPTRRETLWPALDVADEEDKVLVRIELPGVDVKDIDISVVNNTLTLAGEKKEEAEEEGEHFWQAERRYGSFRRDVILPSGVDPDKVEAAYHDGVLTITLPKTEKAKARRIEIKT